VNWNAEVKSDSQPPTVFTPFIRQCKRQVREERERGLGVLGGTACDDRISIQKYEGTIATLGEHLQRK